MNTRCTSGIDTAACATSHSPTIESLAERLDQLESCANASASAARRWRRVAIATGATALAFATLAATQSARTPDVIRARRFEVVDKDDKIVLLAGIGQNGGQLDLWANGGSNVVRIGANNDGGDLSLWNTKQQGVAAIYATPQGARIEATMADASGSAMLRAEGAGPSIVIADGQDRPRVVATAAAGSAGISVRNENGQELAAMGAADGSGGIMRVAQPDGVIASQLLAVESGGMVECTTRAGVRAASFGSPAATTGGSVVLFTPEGSEALTLTAHTDQGSRMALLGPAGDAIAVVEGGADNTGLFALFAQGKRVAALGASTSGGLLNLAKADGRAVVVAGVASDADGGAVSIRSGTGSQLVRLGIDRVGAGEVAVYDGPGTRKRVLNATSAQP